MKLQVILSVAKDLLFCFFLVFPYLTALNHVGEMIPYLTGLKKMRKRKFALL
jgi:hypothetical protein